MSSQNETTKAKRYRGGCHCGRVRFEVTSNLSQVVACNCTAPGKYWSSTTAVSYPLDAWFVEFLNGFVDGGGKLSFGYVRAVRSAS